MGELAKFLVVLCLFTLPYGVTVRALKYPNVAASWSLIPNILYIPYWNMFGELFVQDGRGNDYSYYIILLTKQVHFQ